MHGLNDPQCEESDRPDGMDGLPSFYQLLCWSWHHVSRGTVFVKG